MTTIYSEAKFLAALEVLKCSRSEVVAFLGEATVATVEAALVIAANEAVFDAAAERSEPAKDMVHG